MIPPYIRSHYMNILKGLLARTSCLAFSLVLVACGGGSGSSNGSQTEGATPTPSPTATPISIQTPAPGASLVTISGLVTYDLVPHNNFGVLDYNSTTREPIKGATVQLLDSNDALVDSVTSSETGRYSLTGSSDTVYTVRVLSELRQQGTASWDFSVTDNTQFNAIYALDGSATNSGLTDSQRDLHAPSGWGGSSYTSSRFAAPFAILDSVYQALTMILDTDDQVQLLATQLRWSVNNRPISGDATIGEITTSSYSPRDRVIFILGDETSDADEYDRSVIQHEFTHYLEDTMSRSDSIGGSHSFDGFMDMRLSYSEGLANAFSALASGTGTYSDSFSFQGELSGFLFSIEGPNPFGNPGWFSENSIGTIIYDIADSQDDGLDTLSAGFGPVWRTLTSDSYIENPAFTSIFLFAAEIERQLSGPQASVLSSLLEANNINGVGIYGEGETNNGFFPLNLPVYSVLELGGVANVCTNSGYGGAFGQSRGIEFNALDNRRFIRFQLPLAGSYRIEINSTSESSSNNNPNAALFRNGVFLTELRSTEVNRELSFLNLDSGEYLLEVFALENVDQSSSALRQGVFACFDVTIN